MRFGFADHAVGRLVVTSPMVNFALSRTWVQRAGNSLDGVEPEIRSWLDYRVMNSSRCALIRPYSSTLLTELRYLRQALSFRIT
jgi:hypothetical protein